MTEPPTPAEPASENSSASWTKQQRTLLGAWKNSQAPDAADDEAFVQRVLEACRQVERLPLNQLEDNDAETLAQMVRDAEYEVECDQRERDQRERARRNAGAIHKLVQQHRDYLQARALRLSGRRDIADDLVQETLHRAMVHFDRFTPGTAERAWLTTILTHLYLDHLKHQTVATRAAYKLATDEVIETDLLSELSRIPPARLWNAVESLEPDLRDVVELRFRDDLTYQQIARKLNLQVSTVGTRLSRAIDRLFQQLRPRAA